MKHLHQKKVWESFSEREQAFAKRMLKKDSWYSIRVIVMAARRQSISIDSVDSHYVSGDLAFSYGRGKFVLQ